MNADNLEIQRIRVNRNVWKAGLTKEIISLEDNLDQLYYTAGLKPHRVVRENEEDESNFLDSSKGISQQEIKEFETIINGQVNEVDKAARNICALISSTTEFDLPIPVLILLRLAARVGSIRWSDFGKKLPGTMAKKYVYTRSAPELINTSLTMFRWISTILGTNIIPYQSFINSTYLTILEWTRSSNLMKMSLEQHFLIRSQIFQNIAKSAEQLSLNINFEPGQLKTLLEVELMEHHMESTGLKDKTAGEDALICLDRLFVIYADFLDAQIELKLKTSVIQACISIYRDFERNVIGLACRRQLLRLLESLANRPYASSTTEMAWHVFELAEKFEIDPEIRYLTRRAIKLGLAHRPIVVSHFEVYT